MINVLAFMVLAVFSAAGLAALFLSCPGNLIILIGAVVFAFLTKFSIIGSKSLIILFSLYLFGEVAEYFLVILGAKKFGASNVAVVGAVIGGTAGAILGAPLLGVGILFGAFLGIFFGAFLVELLIQRNLVRSLKAGVGGVIGRIACIAVKVLVAILMLWVIAVRVI